MRRIAMLAVAVLVGCDGGTSPEPRTPVAGILYDVAVGSESWGMRDSLPLQAGAPILDRDGNDIGRLFDASGNPVSFTARLTDVSRGGAVIRGGWLVPTDYEVVPYSDGVGETAFGQGTVVIETADEAWSGTVYATWCWQYYPHPPENVVVAVSPSFDEGLTYTACYY